MRVLTGLLLASLLAAGPSPFGLVAPARATEATPAPAAASPTASPMALLEGAGRVLTELPPARPADRIALDLAAGKAWIRRGEKAFGVSLLADAAQRARALPGDPAGLLPDVAIAYGEAGLPGDRATLLAEAEKKAADKAAHRRLVGLKLAEAGLPAEAEARLGATTAPDARAKLAVAWAKARDNVKAATRAGEALALWRRMPAGEAAMVAPQLAASLWAAGYPAQAMEVAQTLPKGAWPRAPQPLLAAIAERRPTTDAAKRQVLAWLEVALERCNTLAFADMPMEAETIAAIARVFEVMQVKDRPYFCMVAADDRLPETLQRAGADADAAYLTAARASAQVAIGDMYLVMGRGQAGHDRLVRGARLAATLDEDPAEPLAAQGAAVRARAALSRARAGAVDEAVKEAVVIRDPAQRALTLLAIDAMAPDAAAHLNAEAMAALARAGQAQPSPDDEAASN